MIKKIVTVGLSVLVGFNLMAQQPAKHLTLKTGRWNASILRADGVAIPFEFFVDKEAEKTVLYVVNGEERIKTPDIVQVNDSLLIQMPVFESAFRVKLQGNNRLSGVWIKGGADKDLQMPFEATAGKARFGNAVPASGRVSHQVEGKWRVSFLRNGQPDKAPSVGEFTQKGNVVRGAVLTTSGDFRYLDGIIQGDSLMLSTFDGIHAMVFKAAINGDTLKGNFYSSNAAATVWQAVKDDSALVEAPITTVKPGSDGKLNFSFTDLQGHTVSMADARFKNKVVVVQIMGSWCPNCMDEMAYFSDYYKKNKDRGVEFVALAYELSTDVERSKKSLEKFEKQFDVQYPILNTGVTVRDPERTAKTLPQITDIKVFPTSIILDKTGTIHEINTAFYGPGTGLYYEKYKMQFENTINALLN
ncbi:peroxiredoxin family protein [Sphingobacterium sp. Mn56C]|uniref:peroxiredoxin family protein n=1 Tax=Sphingobacterium sp. Mn56C TaxID=3395261 RepID=UPI003BC738CC